MPLDHSKANVTLSVSGIALACINKRERNRCEIGILKCDRHKLVLDIQKIELDPKTRNPIRSCLVHHSLNLDGDILIKVVHPDSDRVSHCERGTTTYEGRGFDRLDDLGDEEDFRWIADLEGPEFHNRKLRIKHKAKLKPIIYLTDGILYTREKTDEAFARVSVKGEPPAVALGKLGYGVSADITCPDGGEVILSNVYDRDTPESLRCPPVRLPKCDRTRYLLTIENHCQSPDESEGTDFRLFYEVVKDPDGIKFDLRRIVETGPCGKPEEPVEDRQNYSLDGFPQNCLVAFMGRTDGLSR